MRAALERGYLSPERLEALRRELFSSPHPGGLLGLLRERALRPEQVQALQQAWQERGRAEPPATFVVPTLPPPDAPAPASQPAPTPPSFRPDGATLPLPPPVDTPPPQAVAATLPAPTPGSAPGSGLINTQVTTHVGDSTLRVGPFELVRELARGGMGVVWVARRAGLDRQVALKQMLSPDGQPHPAHVQRFLDEARLAARLQHPHIVRIHEVGEQGGLPWFAMDLIEGSSLDGRIRDRGPLPPREAAALFAKLARALAYAHGQRLLHRDLKPGNVLISSDGEPVLTDFGLVKSLDDEQGREKLTQQGDLMGTPAYMPPEQAEGEHDRIDQRADVYSLGATFYEALTGFMPFNGRTPVAVLHAVLTMDPTPPRKLVGAIDRDLETIVLRCLEKDPLRRYPSATALAEDLERWLRDEPILARRAGAGERLARWVRRNRAVAGLVGLLVAGLLVGGPAAGLWVLHTRAEAALERERGANAVRERLAGEARQAAEQALAGLAIPDTSQATGLTPAARQAGLDELLGRALVASRAAEQWRSLAPEDPAARQACHEAASLLARVAAAGEQWSVARQAWEEALAVGVDPDGVRGELQQLEARRRARAETRRAEVLGILAEVEGGQLSRQVEGLRGAVMRLVRYTEPELVKLLCERLRALAEEVRAARDELYESARVPTDEEARAGGSPLRPLKPALRRLTAGEALQAAEVEALKEADARLLLRARRRQVEARDARALVARAQGERLGFRRIELAQVLCEALGWIGDPQAVPTLIEYLALEEDEGRAARPALALTMLGGDAAMQAVIAAEHRFPGGGPIASVREGQLRGASREAAEEAALLAGINPADVHLLRQDLPAVQSALDRRLQAKPEDAVALAQRAWVRTVRGDISGARADAQRATDLAPEQGRAWMFLAQAWSAMGEEKRARECADRGVELAPNEVQSWLIRAQMEREQDPLAAGADVEQALQREPNSIMARMLQALLTADLGEFDRALILARELEQLAPRSPDPWLVRGIVAMRTNDMPGALEAVNRALELDDRNPFGRGMRMEIRAVLGDLTGAIDDAEEALRIRPGNFVVLNNSAQILEQLGRLEDAEARYTRCLEVVQNDPVVLNNRGNVRRRLGRLDDARSDLERALKLRDTPQSRVNMAHVLRAQGDLPGALARLEETARDYPDLPEVFHAWASLRLETGQDPQGTLEVAERGLALAPDDGLLRFVRGTSLYQLGRKQEAIADLTRVTELAPRMEMAWVNRGWIRRELGDSQGALADFDQAIKVEPRQTLAWGNRSNLRRELGDLKGALADAEEVLRLTPGDVETLSFRAGTLLLLGRREEGLQAFRALAANDPWAAVWVALLGGDPAPLAAHAQATGWEGAVVRAARGELDEAALLAEAERGADDPDRSRRRCEARWVLGLRAAQAGQPEAARAHYQAGAQEGRGTMVERLWAQQQAQR